jgi:hypothetical protein
MMRERQDGDQANRVSATIRGPTYLKLLDDGSHNVQDLGLSCIRDVVLVVEEDGLQQVRHKTLVNHFEVVSLVNVGADQLEDLLLDGPETADLGHLGGDVTCDC